MLHRRRLLTAIKHNHWSQLPTPLFVRLEMPIVNPNSLTSLVDGGAEVAWGSREVFWYEICC